MLQVGKSANAIRYQVIYSNGYHGLGVYPVVPATTGGGRAVVLARPSGGRLH